jgi:hypothetical protein
MIGLRHGSGGVGLCRHLSLHWAGGRPIIPPLGIQPVSRVVERMVLLEEQHKRIAPCGYG